jgi:hypothetical protein
VTSGAPARDLRHFWPGWVLAGWGVALLLDAWNVSYQRPVTSDDVEQELANRR